MTVKRDIWGKGAPPNGVVPSIALINPKYADNVGKVLRLASCFGFKQVWFTGERVKLELENGQRLPREERMKGFRDVDIYNYDYPLSQFPLGTTPVAIEVRENSESLHTFEHPENAVYVFGPEDGGLPPAILGLCHRFVVVPTRHCLNLATAVSMVLYDRQLKAWLNGTHSETTPHVFEQRGLDQRGYDPTHHEGAAHGLLGGP